MTEKSPSSPAAVAGRKRARPASHGDDAADDEAAAPASPPEQLERDQTHAQTAASSSASSFRNVSACHRCRLRKNKCDQQLPTCATCHKAGVRCVGFDPITKREIPRSYVFYLENRNAYLEALLDTNGIGFAPADEFAQGPPNKSPAGVNGDGYAQPLSEAAAPAADVARQSDGNGDGDRVDSLLSHMSNVAVQGTSDSRFLGSTSGISFARVVFQAVKVSMAGAPSERGAGAGGATNRAANKPLMAGTTSIRDAIFGLHTKPSIKSAPFPGRELGHELVTLYFEHANPQIPILHRPEFMAMFERVYAEPERERTARESYMLNIVFAIGAGTIVGKEPRYTQSPQQPSPRRGGAAKPRKKQKLAEEQGQPEEYHASAIVHLENCLSASSGVDRPFEFHGALEELQAVLLLASFALLRPAAPGLWYITGVAVRLAVDLGLHQEEGTARDDEDGSESRDNGDAGEKCHKSYIRDYRRRLWWCVYSFDRLVSTCVGRPLGISDEAITTNFPSVLDDEFVTPAGLPRETDALLAQPSYKRVTFHYIRLRLLQSEILQVLQNRQAQLARARGVNLDNPYMHTKLVSPFLVDKFGGSFKLWRQDIDRRLWEWKEAAPAPAAIGVRFTPLFLELNYWQAVITLYRQSLSPPAPLTAELRAADGSVHSPAMIDLLEPEDEDEIFLKIAEAGQCVLKLYRQLHRMYLVNYTFLATHHLFMAGISFLYAIWHSPLVRSRLTLDDVDFTVLAATSVLDDLIEKCPPAEACRDAFSRMSKATIKMCIRTTGFGEQVLLRDPNLQQRSRQLSHRSSSISERMDVVIDPSLQFGNGRDLIDPKQMRGRPAPRFDMDLRDLFSDEETAGRSFGQLNMLPPHAARFQSGMQPSYPPAVKREHTERMFTPPPSMQRANIPSPLTSFANSPAPQQLQTATPPPFGLPHAAQYTGLVQNAQQQYPLLSPFSDLDMLDPASFTASPGAAAGTVGQDGFAADWDLSLGLGWDGTLPAASWSDVADGAGAGAGGGGSSNMDLFEGFFFGNASYGG